MRNPNDLSLLIPLLEAESDEVRTAVRLAIMDYCPFLDEMLAQLEIDLSADQQFQLHLVQSDYMSKELSQVWRRILSDGCGLHRLEIVLDFMANMQVDEYPYQPIGRQLDQLVKEYRTHVAVPDVLELSRFLFETKGFAGARNDYDNPLNSNLCYVLNERRGIPIVLSSLLILVGRRLGLHIDGVNLPGHFLAKSVVGGNNLIIDCYNSGRILTAGELASLFFTPAVDFVDLLRRPPSLIEMARRLMKNLHNAYGRQGNIDKLHLVELLLKDIEPNEYPIRLAETEIASPTFSPGQIVRHKRYEYRGVVVAVDVHCLAEDEWYESNLTRPKRNQPWYHVLVDGSKATTYAAQSNLELDKTPSEVNHPLVPFFFLGFADGSYVRNNEPWYWKND